MSTEIDLTERELAEIKDLTKESNPTAALRLALREYVRFAKRQRLLELRRAAGDNLPNVCHAHARSFDDLALSRQGVGVLKLHTPTPRLERATNPALRAWAWHSE